MSEKPKKWKSVKRDIVKWEEAGQSVEGIYADVKERTFEDRIAKLYILMGEGGRVYRFWGTAVLDQAMELIPLRTWVRIEYKGKAGEGNRRYKDFDVEVGEETELVSGKAEEAASS